jgi:cytochrome d ubiquinol oxidase subunit II
VADDRAVPLFALAGRSSPSTQAFLLIGTVFLLPVILMYTTWSYWVFRGKVRGEIGYH